MSSKNHEKNDHGLNLDLLISRTNHVYDILVGEEVTVSILGPLTVLLLSEGYPPAATFRFGAGFERVQRETGANCRTCAGSQS